MSGLLHPDATIVVDSVSRQSTVPPPSRRHRVVIRRPLPIPSKRRASNDSSPRKRLKRSVRKKTRTRSSSPPDMEVDEPEKTESDATDEDIPQEGEGNMDVDEDLYSHLPRLEVEGDKPVR